MDQILSLKPGGFLLCALCCKSFSAMSLGFNWVCRRCLGHVCFPLRTRATSGRTSYRGEGDSRYAFVREGNQLASAVSTMVMVASSMGVIWLVEQPGQSILLAHPRMHQLWHNITAWKRRFWMGCYGGPTAKPHFIVSNSLPVADGIEPWPFKDKVGLNSFYASGS